MVPIGIWILFLLPAIANIFLGLKTPHTDRRTNWIGVLVTLSGCFQAAILLYPIPQSDATEFLTLGLLLFAVNLVFALPNAILFLAAKRSSLPETYPK